MLPAAVSPWQTTSSSKASLQQRLVLLLLLLLLLLLRITAAVTAHFPRVPSSQRLLGSCKPAVEGCAYQPCAAQSYPAAAATHGMLLLRDCSNMPLLPLQPLLLPLLSLLLLLRVLRHHPPGPPSPAPPSGPAPQSCAQPCACWAPEAHLHSTAQHSTSHHITSQHSTAQQCSTTFGCQYSIFSTASHQAPCSQNLDHYHNNGTAHQPSTEGKAQYDSGTTQRSCTAQHHTARHACRTHARWQWSNMSRCRMHPTLLL